MDATAGRRSATWPPSGCHPSPDAVGRAAAARARWRATGPGGAATAAPRKATATAAAGIGGRRQGGRPDSVEGAVEVKVEVEVEVKVEVEVEVEVEVAKAQEGATAFSIAIPVAVAVAVAVAVSIAVAISITVAIPGSPWPWAIPAVPVPVALAGIAGQSTAPPLSVTRTIVEQEPATAATDAVAVTVHCPAGQRAAASVAAAPACGGCSGRWGCGTGAKPGRAGAYRNAGAAGAAPRGAAPAHTPDDRVSND